MASTLSGRWQLRAALCGDANVGKTSLFLRFGKGEDINESEILQVGTTKKTVGSDECIRSFVVGSKQLQV